MTDNKYTVAPAITRELIQNQITMWRNSLENNRISTIVATVIEDKEQVKSLEAVMAKCVKAIEKLESMLAEQAENK